MTTPDAAAKKLVTVVCPVFNEEVTVPLFYARLTKALVEIEKQVRIELLFVNNRSTDRTLDIIHELMEKDPRVNVLTFSRNYGYQASISAGMAKARGDAVCNIDVDCEDPPEMLPRFIQKWLDGADVVYGVRDKREEFILMHWGRKLFYRFTRRVADHEIVLDMAEFFLVDKRVRDAVLNTRSSIPFVRGQVGYVGFRREGIPYKRERRIAGETHYNLISAAKFGIAGILSSSTMPLRALAWIGALVVVCDLAAAGLIVALGDRIGLTPFARGAIAFGLVNAAWFAIAFGVVGIYLARVYKDVVGLPLYVV
ncbi:MAG: glycosyltransferase family 2 protein, partial [Polyangiales bacterium]